MLNERDRAIAKICELIIECGVPPDLLVTTRKTPQFDDVEKRLQAASQALLGNPLASDVRNNQYDYYRARTLQPPNAGK
jgi:hypothetical protein